MAYTPLNTNLFVAAYAGALAGMGVSDRVPTQSTIADYAGLAVVAGTYAIALDQAWGASKPNSLDIYAVQTASAAAWQERAPQANVPSNIAPATYAALASAVVAIVKGGDAYFAAQGIMIPPAPGGGGGGAGSELVFRPGVASQDNAYATWAEIETQIALVEGACSVAIDPQYAPCIIPSTANTECFGRTTLVSFGPGTPTLEISDGARLRNLGAIEAVRITATPTTRAPLYFSLFTIAFCEFGTALVLGAGSTQSFIEIAAAGDAAVIPVRGAALDGTAAPTVPFITIDAGAQLILAIIDNTQPWLSTHVFAGDGTTVAIVISDSSASLPTQALFSGTLITQQISQFQNLAGPFALGAASGNGNTATGANALAQGGQSAATGDYSTALGLGVAALGIAAHATGNGSQGLRQTQNSHASGMTAFHGDAQESFLVLRGATAGAAPGESVELHFGEAADQQFTFENGKAYAIRLHCIADSAADCASFVETLLIKQEAGFLQIVAQGPQENLFSAGAATWTLLAAVAVVIGPGAGRLALTFGTGTSTAAVAVACSARFTEVMHP